MEKEQVLMRIRETGVVAVVRAETSDQAVRISEACLAGGISAIEVTFTVPRAHTVIADLARRFSPDQLLLGAGSVLDPETARIALLEGATYIVSPALNEDTIRLCHRYRVACMPGCLTIREVLAAMEAGADILKVFPGELATPAFLKAVAGPIPAARMMPTGGVSLDNVAQWIAAGAVAVGVGGQLTAGAKTGNYTQITETARQFVEAVKAARTKEKP